MQETQLKNLGKLRFKRTLCFSEMKTKDQVVIGSKIHFFFFTKYNYYFTSTEINKYTKGRDKRE